MALPCMRLLFTSSLTTLCAGFHFGYQLAIGNSASLVFQQFINESAYTRYDWHITASTMRVIWAAYMALIMLAAIFGGRIAANLRLFMFYISQCNSISQMQI